MTIDETKHKILSDADFVASECRKLQTLYKLKSVIRYDFERHEEIDTESVAEHVYGMHVLASYFLPLENSDGSWDKEKIRLMIQYHDADEIITGDKVGYLKTLSDKENEAEAKVSIIRLLPDSLKVSVSEALEEYDEQATAESKFVKAIDKIEPGFHLYNINGIKIVQHLKVTRAENRSIKDKFIAPFSYINRFHNVVEEAMQNEVFFTTNP